MIIMLLRMNVLVNGTGGTQQKMLFLLRFLSCFQLKYQKNPKSIRIFKTSKNNCLVFRKTSQN